MKAIFPLISKFSNRMVLLLTILLAFSNVMISQVLTGVDPDEGMQGETLDLVISGQNTHFLQATSITVNLQQGSATIIMPEQIGFMSNQAIQATFGFSFSHDPGMYDLKVANEIDDTMYLYDAFEIQENPVQPELVGIDPNTAVQGEELDLIISGQNTHFQASTTTVALKQGSVTILPQYKQVLNDSEISAHFAFSVYHPIGVYDLHTDNYFDGPLTLPDAFILELGEAPSLAGIEPASAPNGTLYNFNVYGENTHFLDASGHMAWLMQNGTEIIGLEYDVINNEHLQGTVVLPHISPPGSWDLHVVNNLDGEVILEDAFVLEENPEDPVVLYMEPDSAYLGQSVEVNTFSQHTFFDWALSLNAWMKKSGSFQNIYNQGIQIIGDEELKIDFIISQDAIPGYYDIYITDNLDGEMVGIEQFYIIDTITGVEEYLKTGWLNLYPNPIRSEVYISSYETLKACRLTINNFAGQQIEVYYFDLYKDVPFKIDFSNLPEGMYFLNLVNQEHVISKKIIKY